MNEFNPYEAPQSVVEDMPPDQGWMLADRGTRLGAVLLDGLIWGAAAMIGVLVMLPSISQGRSGDGFLPVLVGGFLFFAAIFGVLIWNLVWLYRSGQTIGKRILNVRIVRSNGESASLGRIFGLRMVVPAVLGAIPILGPLFSLTDPLFIFGNDRRCLHDHLADTIVIRA